MSTADRKQQKLSELRNEALALARAGKHAAALGRFSKLESLEGNEGEWPRRAAECHQALGNEAQRLTALGRAADCYVRVGMLVKAMAMYRLVLASDPRHPAALDWMSKLESPALKPPQPPIPVTPARPAAARTAETPTAPEPGPTSAHKLAAARGLVAVARKVASRAKQNQPPNLDPPPANLVAEQQSHESSPPSSGGWQAVDDSDLVEAEAHPNLASEPGLVRAEASIPPLLSLPPLSVHPERLRALVPGSIALPGGSGMPSGMFRLAIDGAQIARAEKTLHQAREVLPAIPLFSELDPKTLEGLARHSRLLHLRSGETVFKQGDPPDSLYVVVNGQVVVIDETASRIPLYRLGENEFFGESGLISNESQAVTVEASEDSDLLAFDREAMRTCISDNPAVVPLLLRFLRERMIEHLVHVSPLFTGFDTAERRALTRRFEFIEFQQGSQLIRQGVRSPGLFVLLSGAVEVMLQQATREHRLATLERGGVFGEMSLLGRPAAIADVRSIRPGFTLLLPFASFREIIMTHPQFLEVVTSFCEERREANERLLGALT